MTTSGVRSLSSSLSLYASASVKNDLRGRNESRSGTLLRRMTNPLSLPLARNPCALRRTSSPCAVRPHPHPGSGHRVPHPTEQLALKQLWPHPHVRPWNTSCSLRSSCTVPRSLLARARSPIARRASPTGDALVVSRSSVESVPSQSSQPVLQLRFRGGMRGSLTAAAASRDIRTFRTLVFSSGCLQRREIRKRLFVCVCQWHVWCPPPYQTAPNIFTSTESTHNDCFSISGPHTQSKSHRSLLLRNHFVSFGIRLVRGQISIEP